MRRPWMTTEFWIMILSIAVNVGGIVDFPKEAWATVIAWILARVLHKSVAASKGAPS